MKFCYSVKSSSYVSVKIRCITTYSPSSVIHLSTCYAFKNYVVQEISLLFCNNSLITISPLLIFVLAVIANCKNSVVHNKFLRSYCLHHRHRCSGSTGSIIIVVVWLTIFEHCLPNSDTWQPKHTFDMHLFYLAVITVKI